MSLSLAVLLLLALAALLFALSPLRARITDAPDDARSALEEEREALLTALAELDGEPGEEAARERTRLKARAARVLAQLDTLEPRPLDARRRPLLPALVGVVLAVAVVAVGAFTFIPRWQLASLAPDEASAVQSVVQIPALARQAAASGSEADQLRLARAAFSAGRFQEAASVYGTLLRANPRQPEALRRVGLILLSQGEKPDEAAQFIQAAAQLAPTDPESQLYLGFALARFGEDAAALSALTRYQQLKPEGHEADDLIAQLKSRSQPVSAGARVYAQNCASCHGPAGAGGIGPSLKAQGLTRELMVAVIKNGKGTMPAFPSLQGADLNALLDLLAGWQKAQ